MNIAKDKVTLPPIRSLLKDDKEELNRNIIRLIEIYDDFLPMNQDDKNQSIVELIQISKKIKELLEIGKDVIMFIQFIDKLNNNNKAKSCLNCGKSNTPEWRRGPDGPKTFCNACGLSYSKLLKKYKINEANKIIKERKKKL